MIAAVLTAYVVMALPLFEESSLVAMFGDSYLFHSINRRTNE